MTTPVDGQPFVALHLRSGEVLHGTLVATTPTGYLLQTDARALEIEDAEVSQLTFEEPAPWQTSAEAQAGEDEDPEGRFRIRGSVRFDLHALPQAARSEAITQLLFAHPRRRVFALLDAARLPESLWGACKRLGVEDPRALYAGALSKREADTTPWLIEVEREGEFLRWSLDQGWGQHWGTYLVSGASAPALARFLRPFLSPVDVTGEALTFRFYDPRVLRLYLTLLWPAELAALFGAAWEEDVQGELELSCPLCGRPLAPFNPSCVCFEGALGGASADAPFLIDAFVLPDEDPQTLLVARPWPDAPQEPSKARGLQPSRGAGDPPRRRKPRGVAPLLLRDEVLESLREDHARRNR